jgi:hemoglobin
MNRGKTLIAALTFLGMIALTFPLAAHHQEGQPSLYKRLGGYDAIAAVVDDFIGRMAGDPQLRPFFAGHSTESLKKIRQLVVDQLCEASGGPCYYTGRSMKESHHGMGITQAHWDTAVKHLIATLDKFKVGQKEREDLFAAIGPLQADIVDKK